MMSKLYLTIVLGLMSVLIGFLAQRSRMCFVAGFRDYFLVRDRELLTGLFSFIVTIWVLTSVFYSMDILRKGIPEYGAVEVRRTVEQISISIHNLKQIALVSGGAGGMSVSVFFTNRFLYVTFLGGLFIGLVSTFSGGCVLRQHVLVAQGSMDALYFIFGFYGAVVIYYGFLFRFFVKLY